MEDVIFVSNRLPVTIRRNKLQKQEFTPSAGGLVTGLMPVHKKGGLWVGHPGEEPEASLKEELIRQRMIPVSISHTDYRGFYLGYSNSALWPLFHYSLDRCVFRPEDYRAYRRVNEQFADVVAEHARPDSTIWVHDYQLMLLPELLRQRLPHARIGFFLHIPFPSVEMLRTLPQNVEVLRGLMGADLIGLHSYEYVENFVRSIRRILGLEARESELRFEGRTVRMESMPLGIDAQALRKQAFTDEATSLLSEYREAMRGRKVILGVDRLDYTKGLPFKLEAFRKLLATSERWRRKVVLIQVAVPTRSGIESYRQQRHEVERLVGEINGAYGSPGSTPVQYIYRSIPLEELGALYRLADVALVTPIRDGLNLVAKEYVACRDTDGVLVLSEFAGAAGELPEAVRVNPWDIEGTAMAIRDALEMHPAEQQTRMAAMRRRVLENDVHRWVERFIGTLLRPRRAGPLAPPLLAAYVLAGSIGPDFASAGTALLMLDYDGTLREFTRRYEDAVPDENLLSLLRALAGLPGVSVALISGRDRHTLARWFKDVPVSLISEHGAWVRFSETGEWRQSAAASDMAWKARALQVMQDFASRTPGARIEEKSASIVWHYRESPDEIGAWQALQLASLLEGILAQSPAEVMIGAQVVEVRQQGINKGLAYELVVRERGPFDFVLGAGDDRTDEDLFARIGADGYTVHVGSGPSRARVAVAAPAQMRRLLEQLAESRARRTGVGGEARTNLAAG